jgi:hypothetical protein
MSQYVANDEVNLGEEVPPQIARLGLALVQE